MRLANDLDFDLDTFRGQRALAQGASGSGKSNLIRLVLEQSFGTAQHVVIDVEDEFHTLRTTDRPYMILGGENGDSPLTPKHNARELALTLLQVGASVILQIGDWTLDEKRYFIGEFIGGMMSAKNTLWHPTIVVLDEAHNWAPQGAVVSSSEAVTHLATAGRKRGFSMLLATQRLSLISKDVTGVCENKFLGRVEQALDRRSAADLLGFGPTSADAKDMQSFEPGEFYVVGPAVSKLPRRVQLDRAETKAPEPGSTVVPSPTPEAVQKALAALAAATVEPETVQSDGTGGEEDRNAYLKAYNRGFEEGSAAAQREYHRGVGDGVQQALKSAGQRVLQFAADFALFTNPENPVEMLRAMAMKTASELGLGVDHAGFDLAAAYAEETVPMPPGRRAPATKSPVTPDDYSWHEVDQQPGAGEPGEVTDITHLAVKGPDIVKGKRSTPAATNLEIRTSAEHRKAHGIKEESMVTMARQIWPAKLSWNQLASLVGKKARGGHFNTTRKRLLEDAIVREVNGLVDLVHPPTMPAGKVPADVLGEVLPEPARKMFNVIREQPGITWVGVAERLGMQPRGGHWNTGRAMLRSNELVEEMDGGQSTPWLRVKPELGRP